MQVFFADDQGTKYALAEILASFVGLCHHLFYAAMYGDYRLPQEPTPRLAWEHFARKAAPYESIGPPPKGPWIERISHGIAWLIFHEFGHFAHRRSINSSKFREAFLKPEMACEECEADVSAYSHLSMRLRAQDPLNTLDTQAELCLGIEGVLHIAEALAALDRGGLGRKEPPRLNDGPFTPSAYLRRTFLRDFYESAQGLGLLPSNLTRGPKRLALRSPASRSPSTPN